MILGEDRAHRGAHFEGIAWTNHDEIGDRTQEGDILAGMMRGPKPRIGQPRSDRDDRHGHVMVAGVGPDLFEAARRDEGRDRIGEGAKARHGEPGGDAHHILLGDAAIEETRSIGGPELVEQAIADIARQHDDTRIGAELGELVGERVSHASPSSAKAFWTSAAVGAR